PCTALHLSLSTGAASRDGHALELNDSRAYFSNPLTAPERCCNACFCPDERHDCCRAKGCPQPGTRFWRGGAPSGFGQRSRELRLRSRSPRRGDPVSRVVACT